MSSLRDQLEREVASLYAFVEAVSSACSPAPQALAYTESSTEFFNFIVDLAESTKKHLVGFERHADDSDEDFREARGELWTLRSAWRQLHQYIKPSADADTLDQPTALVDAMVTRLRLLQGFETTSFTIFHTDTFDYLQVNPGAISDAVAELARVVGARPLRDNLGLIGLPNSQGNALFMNCMLAHEIGEYVYAKRGIEAVLAGAAGVAVPAKLGTEFSNAKPTDQRQFKTVVIRWAKELFCDLFALRLIGPCYALAFAELFDMVNLLDSTGHVVTEESVSPPLQFYAAHPSHPFRSKLQVDSLKSEGWWDHLASLDSRHITALAGLLELDYKVFVDAGVNSGIARLVEALIEILPDIRSQVGEATKGLDPGIHEYALVASSISEYLENGVVPSTLNIKDENGKFVAVCPSPLVLLNACYAYYLVGVEKLMAKVQNQDHGSSRDRVFWMKRIEAWTAKALDDVALISSCEKP